MYLNFHIYDRPDDPVEMAYYFWLIRNDETTVVVDTGFSQHGAQVRSRTFLIEPLRAFQLLGVDPDTGPPVVVTHAHYDHIGNLDLFGNSRITMSRTELEFWLSPFSERRQYKHSVETDELKVLAAAHAEGRIDVFDGHHVLMPGIELIEVGGHTPGQAVVKVDTAQGRGAAGVGRGALLRRIRDRTCRSCLSAISTPCTPRSTASMRWRRPGDSPCRLRARPGDAQQVRRRRRR